MVKFYQSKVDKELILYEYERIDNEVKSCISTGGNTALLAKLKNSHIGDIAYLCYTTSMLNCFKVYAANDGWKQISEFESYEKAIDFLWSCRNAIKRNNPPEKVNMYEDHNSGNPHLLKAYDFETFTVEVYLSLYYFDVQDIKIFDKREDKRREIKSIVFGREIASTSSFKVEGKNFIVKNDCLPYPLKQHLLDWPDRIEKIFIPLDIIDNGIREVLNIE